MSGISRLETGQADVALQPARRENNDRNQHQINQSGRHVSLEKLEVGRSDFLHLGKKIRELDEESDGRIFEILDDLVGQ